MPLCNGKENQDDLRVCYFTNIKLLFAPTMQPEVRAIVGKDCLGLQKSKVNTSGGGLKRENIYLQVSLAAGFMLVFSVPLVVSCTAAWHAVGQLWMCAVLLCPREGELQPHGLPSPHVWTRGAAIRCSGILLSQMCGPWP